MFHMSNFLNGHLAGLRQGPRLGLFGVLVLLGAIVGLQPSQALAQQDLASKEIELTITGTGARQVPVAVVDFVGQTSQEQDMGMEIARIVRSNLSRAGLLRTIDPKMHPQDSRAALLNMQYPQWQLAGSDNVITGRIKVSQYGRLNVEFFLNDTVRRNQLMALSFSTMANNWRRVGHVISDEVMKRLTGEDGAFDTRIVYVAESGPKTRRTKQLAIMDQDGGNHRILTGNDLLVTTPRFSPASQEITYVALQGNTWRVFIYNLETGQQEVISDFQGTPTAPRFSPKGDRMVLSISFNGNTDLYEVDLTTRRRTRLTNSQGIDTAASYGPGGRRLVFESDRGGSQQLYIKALDTGEVRRISRGQGSYATPVWSPTGEWIAFTKRQGEDFHIGIMRPDGTDERLLTSGFVAESPTWAPNGRLLAYYKQEPTQQGDSVQTALYAVDLFTYQERLVMTPNDASDPAWSPRLR